MRGCVLIGVEFQKAMKEMGVEGIKSVGHQFDPKVHEAVSEEESQDVAEGIVIKQWRSGYKIGDKIIRPASVVVSKGPGAAPSGLVSEAPGASEPKA